MEMLSGKTALITRRKLPALAQKLPEYLQSMGQKLRYLLGDRRNWTR